MRPATGRGWTHLTGWLLSVVLSADGELALHARGAVTIDRAIEVVGPGLERDGHRRGRAGRSGRSVLVDAVALDADRVGEAARGGVVHDDRDLARLGGQARLVELQLAAAVCRHRQLGARAAAGARRSGLGPRAPAWARGGGWGGGGAGGGAAGLVVVGARPAAGGEQRDDGDGEED